MKILALDMATITGWATNEPRESGRENFKHDLRGEKYHMFWRFLCEYGVGCDMIVYEEPAIYRSGAAAQLGYGFLAIIQFFCAKHYIKTDSIHPKTLKKYATGNGNATKADMMEAYRVEFGEEPIDDNESDARFILKWAESKHTKDLT